MARINGNAGSFKIATWTGSATTPAAVVAITDWELDITAAADEATGMDSAGHQEFTAGIDGWKGSASGFWDTTETDIISATIPVLFPGQKLDAIFMLTATSTQQYSGVVQVTNFKPTVGVSGNIKMSVDFQGTGTVTVPTT